MPSRAKEQQAKGKGSKMPDNIDRVLYAALTMICEENGGEAAAKLQWIIDNTPEVDSRHAEAVRTLAELRG
jgi:hypothetical protein